MDMRRRPNSNSSTSSTACLSEIWESERASSSSPPSSSESYDVMFSDAQSFTDLLMLLILAFGLVASVVLSPMIGRVLGSTDQEERTSSSSLLDGGGTAAKELRQSQLAYYVSNRETGT